MPDRLLGGVCRNRLDSGLSVGFGSDDPELPSGGRLRLPDDHVDVAPKRGQHAKQALQRMFTEVAAQEARHIERKQVEQPRGLGLGNAARAEDVVDAVYQPGFEEVRVGTVDDLNEATDRGFDRTGVRNTTGEDLARLEPATGGESEVAQSDGVRLRKLGIRRMMVMDVRDDPEPGTRRGRRGS